jgi:hypothetical protein
VSIHYKLGVVFAAIAFSSVSFAQTPDVKPERIRGDIVSFKGEMLTVHRNSGDTVSIDVKPDVGVSAFKAARLADAKVGSYVGTPALTGSDGKLTATSMIVFPEAARGTAEVDIVNYDVRLRDNYDGRSTGVIVAVNWL